MEDPVQQVTSQLSSVSVDFPSLRHSVSLDPPSFRTLYDGSAPIIFPSGPVTLQSLLAGAVTGAPTSLASSLVSLCVRGHSLPLLSPPLLLLKATKLTSFSMKGKQEYILTDPQ